MRDYDINMIFVAYYAGGDDADDDGFCFYGVLKKKYIFFLWQRTWRSSGFQVFYAVAFISGYLLR